MKDQELIKASCEKGIQGLEDRDDYQKAVKMYKNIMIHNDVVSTGSQIQRAAESVVLNIAEGVAKGYKGVTASVLLIARGSAWEVYAALQIGPRHLREDCLQDTKNTILAIERSILDLC